MEGALLNPLGTIKDGCEGELGQRRECRKGTLLQVTDQFGNTYEAPLCEFPEITGICLGGASSDKQLGYRHIGSRQLDSHT